MYKTENPRIYEIINTIKNNVDVNKEIDIVRLGNYSYSEEGSTEESFVGMVYKDYITILNETYTPNNILDEYTYNLIGTINKNTIFKNNKPKDVNMTEWEIGELEDSSKLYRLNNNIELLADYLCKYYSHLNNKERFKKMRISRYAKKEEERIDDVKNKLASLGVVI